MCKSSVDVDVDVLSIGMLVCVDGDILANDCFITSSCGIAVAGSSISRDTGDAEVGACAGASAGVVVVLVVVVAIVAVSADTGSVVASSGRCVDTVDNVGINNDVVVDVIVGVDVGIVVVVVVVVGVAVGVEVYVDDDTIVGVVGVDVVVVVDIVGVIVATVDGVANGLTNLDVVGGRDDGMMIGMDVDVDVDVDVSLIDN